MPPRISLVTPIRNVNAKACAKFFMTKLETFYARNEEPSLRSNSQQPWRLNLATGFIHGHSTELSTSNWVFGGHTDTYTYHSLEHRLNDRQLGFCGQRGLLNSSHGIIMWPVFLWLFTLGKVIWLTRHYFRLWKPILLTAWIKYTLPFSIWVDLITL